MPADAPTSRTFMVSITSHHIRHDGLKDRAASRLVGLRRAPQFIAHEMRFVVQRDSSPGARRSWVVATRPVAHRRRSVRARRDLGVRRVGVRRAPTWDCVGMPERSREVRATRWSSSNSCQQRTVKGQSLVVFGGHRVVVASASVVEIRLTDDALFTHAVRQSVRVVLVSSASTARPAHGEPQLRDPSHPDRQDHDGAGHRGHEQRDGHRNRAVQAKELDAHVASVLGDEVDQRDQEHHDHCRRHPRGGRASVSHAVVVVGRRIDSVQARRRHFRVRVPLRCRRSLRPLVRCRVHSPPHGASALDPTSWDSTRSRGG